MKELTLLEKHEAVLADLLEEYDNAEEGWWKFRLERKIADMREAIKNLK